MKKKKRISKAISALNSILLIVLGILVICAKEYLAWSLGIVFGVMFIAVGAVTIIYAVAIKKMILGSGWLIIQGVLSIVLGIVLTTVRDASVGFVSFVMATRLVIRGVAKMLDSNTLRRFRVSSWWLTLLLGALYFILGFLMYFLNGLAGDVVAIVIGSFAITSGLLNIVELIDITKREKREKSIIKSLNKSIEDDVNHVDIDFTKDGK